MVQLLQATLLQPALRNTYENNASIDLEANEVDSSLPTLLILTCTTIVLPAAMGRTCKMTVHRNTNITYLPGTETTFYIFNRGMVYAVVT